MNVYDYYTDITEEFTFPDAAVSPTATVTFEWGDTIVASTSATNVSGNTYSISIPDELVDSSGVYSIKWEAEIGGTDRYFYTSFMVERPYTTYASWIATFPEYDSYTEDEFGIAEKYARFRVDTFCGQSFQFIKNKSVTTYGTGRNSLYLPERIENFSEVLISGIDYTNVLYVERKDKRFLKILNDQGDISDEISIRKFGDGAKIVITGDWGWIDVPSQVEMATKLFICDMIDDVRRENYRYNVQRLWQDTNRLEMNVQGYETTGNLDVDVLLMDYIYWVMDYVS